MHRPLDGDEDQGAGADCGMTADGVPAQPVNTGNLRSLPKASLPRGLPPPTPLLGAPVAPGASTPYRPAQPAPFLEGPR